MGYRDLAFYSPSFLISQFLKGGCAGIGRVNPILISSKKFSLTVSQIESKNIIEIVLGDMFENFETRGVWWLPSDSNKKIHGRLIYDRFSGAILELNGSFEPITEINKLHEYDIINGLAGSEITLFKCWDKGHQIQFPGTLNSQYYANCLFKGKIFTNSSEIKFKEASINYHLLNTWINLSGIKVTPDGKTNNFKIETHTIDPILVDINENVTLSLTFPISIYMNTKDGIEYTIKQNASFYIESKNEIPFEEFLKISFIFQQFLSLCTNEPIQIIEFIGEVSVADEGIDKKPVEYFGRIQSDILKKIEGKHPNEMPVSLDIIKDRLNIILQNWYAKYELLKDVFSLYFALQYNPKMYVEHKFLNLIYCLESYHRRKFDGQYLSEVNYQLFKETMIASIPDISDENYSDFKQGYIQSFEYGNELKLRKRLKLLIKECEPVINKYIKNNRKFIDIVINTRNYRTHFDKKIEHLAISKSREFYVINLQLKLLVEVCIFKELGFDLSEIEAILSKNREYQEILR
jgi:hypothetical protein